MTVAHAPLQESDMLWKSGGQALVNREKEAHDRAEAIFKKTEDRRLKIAAQYEAEANAVRANTARLKALRLASEAVTDWGPPEVLMRTGIIPEVYEAGGDVE